MLGHHFADFFAAEHQQHIAHFAARAGAGKFDVFRCKHARRGFVKQAVEHVLRIQIGQLMGRGGARQRFHMIPGFGIEGFFRQTLQQQTAHSLIGCGQRNKGVELLGALHVIHQHFGNAATLKRHHALPRLALLRLQGNHKHAVVAKQIAQIFIITDFGLLVPTRSGAAGVAGSGFYHQHFQAALPLNLHNQRALDFKIARKQRAGGEQFAQSLADGGRIMFAPLNVLPHFLQAHMQPAHGHVVENKTGAAVGLAGCGGCVAGHVVLSA